MKVKLCIAHLIFVFSIVTFFGCSKEGPAGQDGLNGLDATVYYSAWISPTSWKYDSNTGEYYFDVNAPDLTQDMVENGQILAYCSLDGDLYNSSAVRPLPAYAVGANWSFLIPDYGVIEFTTDMTSPGTTGNYFRFIAIPATTTSPTSLVKSAINLKSMSYKDVCKLYNIPE